MNTIKKKQIEQQIIFLSIFFVVIGILILFNYFGASIQMSITLLMIPVAVFAIGIMIKDYKRGVFPKRLLLGPISSYITIKKHPIRAAINFIFWGSFYTVIIIYFVIELFLFFKNLK